LVDTDDACFHSDVEDLYVDEDCEYEGGGDDDDDDNDDARWVDGNDDQSHANASSFSDERECDMTIQKEDGDKEREKERERERNKLCRTRISIWLEKDRLRRKDI
jgi:hypothetical protein